MTFCLEPHKYAWLRDLGTKLDLELTNRRLRYGLPSLSLGHVLLPGKLQNEVGEEEIPLLFPADASDAALFSPRLKFV